MLQPPVIRSLTTVGYTLLSAREHTHTHAGGGDVVKEGTSAGKRGGGWMDGE